MTSVDLEAARYPDRDDLPHQPGPEPGWQESYVFSWYDDAAGVGGFYRLGHEPNKGVASTLCGVITADGMRFRRNADEVGLSDGDRGEHLFAAGPRHRLLLGDERRMEVHDEECDLALEVEDFYPLYDYFAVTSGQVVGAAVGSSHYQVAGRVRGQVRLGDHHFEVDGLCHRDHSWGNREWSAVLAHRWLAGTFGPDLSFSLTTALMPGGRLIRMGFMARDGEVFPVSDVDVTVALAADGLTHRAGWGRARLPDGEEMHLRAEVVDGIVVSIRGLVAVEGIGRVHLADRVGFCDLEASNNPRQGEAPPPLALHAALEDGLTRR